MSKLTKTVLAGLEQQAFERVVSHFRDTPAYARDANIRALVESVARLGVNQGMLVLSEFIVEANNGSR